MATDEAVAVVEGRCITAANPAFLRLCGHSSTGVSRLDAVSGIFLGPDSERLLNFPATTEPGAPPHDLLLQVGDGRREPISLRVAALGDAVLLLARPRSPLPPEGAGGLRRVEESRNRYRELVDGLADGLVTVSERGELLYVNRTFSEMLGQRSRSTFVARSFLELVHEPDRSRVRRELSRWERGEVSRFELNLLHQEGRVVPVLVSGRALPRGSTGAYRGALLLITDYAERRAIVERLEVARKMDGLSTLAGGIAHDFNNLLTSVLGNASRIRTLAPGGEVDELARAVEDSAELAARLTQRLLALVRGQAPHRRILDVGELVGHTLSLFQRVLPASMEVRSELPLGLPPVLADESQFQQAVLNLCMNARDAMAGSERPQVLTVQVFATTLRKPCDDGMLTEEPAVGLRVRDSGPGVPESLRARIFDPFFTTKGVGRGVGLGLAMVWQLVDAHGGTVDVGDTPGGGATFTLKLPALPGKRPTPASRASRRTDLGGPGQATVLVAEDERAIRDLVGRSLEQQGYRVLLAADGQAAIALIDEHGPAIDLLFLDVRMPGADGPEVLRHARARWPMMPALISSGFVPEESDPRATLGKVAFLPKPYRVPELIEAVRRAILGTGTSDDSPPTGDFPPLDDADATGAQPFVRAGQHWDPGATSLDIEPITADPPPPKPRPR
jgi:two-component system cell cycle sensor histidine kinase/response regulator CckA